MRFNISKGKNINKSLAGNISILFFLVICGLFMSLPLIYTAVSAFKPINELFLYPPRFFVQHPTFDNFTAMFKLASSFRVPFERYLFNTGFVTIFGTIVYVVISGLAAYPLAKHKMPGKLLLVNMVVWAMLFRPEVTSLPQYIIFSRLHILNNYLALILPGLAGSMGVFLMRQFIIAFVPDALLESAKIDGASEYKLFWRIVMPIVKPAWLTLTIFTFTGLWNYTGVQYIYVEPMKVLPVVLQQISSVGIARAGAASAVALFLIIPPIILFLFCQSSVIETMSTAGIK